MRPVIIFAFSIVSFIFVSSALPVAFGSRIALQPASPVPIQAHVLNYFKPSTMTISPGSHRTNTNYVFDKAKVSYTFSGCQLFHKASTSKKWTIETCSVKTFTVNPGQTSKRTWSTSIPTSTPKELEEFKVVFVGANLASPPGYYNVTVS